MSTLKHFIKNLFSRTDKPGLQESPETLRAVFKSRYRGFRALLDANNRALEIMSDMEHALRGNQSFGMAFVRENCTAISANVYKIIQNMNEISSNRYAVLFDVFEEIRNKINTIWDARKEFATGEWPPPLEAVDNKTSAEKSSPMKESPVYNILESMLEHILPLNFTDPEASNFTSKGCQTYRDITHFCHEKAVREMFGFGKHHYFPERSSKRLIGDVPMQWWVIDLDDGFKEPVEGDTVKLENIASIPMLAVWEGITAMPWRGPPPVDTKGFLSVMFRSTMDPSLDPTRRSRYSGKNYFMISKHFCNLASRLGYHVSTIEAFVGDYPRKNYASFHFKGGAADFNRRVLRVKFIEHILRQFDFRVEINGDCIMARLEGQDQNFLIERLKVLGYVSIHTRQLDMIMANQDRVNYYMNQHLNDIHSFVSV